MLGDDILKKLRQACPDLRLGEPLAPHTTVRVGGPVAAMAFPHTDAELAGLLRIAAHADPRPEFAVIGGGANLFGDSGGFDGLVVSTTARGGGFQVASDGILVADSGARLSDIALAAARLGWGGVNFMAEVPGTIGGAVAINAGTNIGGYVADRFLWVETLGFDGETRRRSPEEMAFDYRTSALLHGREIILRAAFQLESCDRLGQTPEALVESFQAVMADRARKFPLDQPNFGSTFRSPGAPHPPAGKLIDDLGMKGTRIGDAQISRQHANFIVNLGSATSADIIALMTHMRDAVAERYGVALRPEVHYLSNADQPRPDFFPDRPTIL